MTTTTAPAVSPAAGAPSLSGTAGPPRRPSRTSRIRWRDGEWQVRCESCVLRHSECWWPLSFEFWDRWAMAKCRACTRESKRVKELQRRRAESSEQRSARLERVREYRVDAADVINFKRSAANLSDEDLERRRRRDRERRANETPQQREKRLGHIRAWRERNPERAAIHKREYLASPRGKAVRHEQWLRRKARLGAEKAA